MNFAAATPEYCCGEVTAIKTAQKKPLTRVEEARKLLEKLHATAIFYKNAKTKPADDGKPFRGSESEPSHLGSIIPKYATGAIPWKGCTFPKYSSGALPW